MRIEGFFYVRDDIMSVADYAENYLRIFIYKFGMIILKTVGHYQLRVAIQNLLINCKPHSEYIYLIQLTVDKIHRQDSSTRFIDNSRICDFYVKGIAKRNELNRKCIVWEITDCCCKKYRNKFDKEFDIFLMSNKGKISGESNNEEGDDV